MPLSESLSTEVLFGPPKDLAVDAFGSVLRGHSSKIMVFNHLAGFPVVLRFHRGQAPRKYIHINVKKDLTSLASS